MTDPDETTPEPQAPPALAGSDGIEPSPEGIPSDVPEAGAAETVIPDAVPENVSIPELVIPDAAPEDVSIPEPVIPDAAIAEALAEPVIPPPSIPAMEEIVGDGDAAATRAARRAGRRRPAIDAEVVTPPVSAATLPPLEPTSGGYRALTIVIYAFLLALLAGAIVVITLLSTSANDASTAIAPFTWGLSARTALVG